MILPYMALFALVLSVILKWDYIYSWVRSSAFDICDSKTTFSEKNKLLVGVLSAQSNFRARQAIRESWGQLSTNKSIDILFLIGEEICPYPLEDRITPYNCELWFINVPKALDEYSTAGGSMSMGSCQIGFTFLVKMDITVNKLGLDYSTFKNNKSDKARVVLYNSMTGEKLASATFIKEDVSGFVWKPIKSVLLEKGFEGELKLHGDNIQISHCNILLQYIAPVYFFETIDNSGHYNQFELGNFKPSLVAMNYSLYGSLGLDQLLVKRTNRFSKWLLSMNLLKQQLDDEQKKYNDILFLGGFADAYDNLSFKVAVFLDWAKKMDQWLYILKTDDDVFLDLNVIEEGLNESSFDLWSCMKNQPPNLSGKWRDRTFVEYPIFPSGSGYVISMEALKQFPVTPKYKLGEDVMIGFAFEKAKILFKHVCIWACSPVLVDKVRYCNAPELNPLEMRKVWESYNKSGYILSSEKYLNGYIPSYG